MEKMKEFFPDVLVYKSSDRGRFFKDLSIPSFIRDWLVMKFSDEAGNIDKESVLKYVRNTIPKKEQWEQIKYKISCCNEEAKFLAKVKVSIDIASGNAFFSLPDFAFSSGKGIAVVDKNVVDDNKETLLSPNEVWGVVTLITTSHSQKDEYIIRMIDYKPFRPYNIVLSDYIDARANFTVDEWIDVLLMAIDYNPIGYTDVSQKLTMLARLLPFVEKRVNLIELAPKGTGKSYLFSQISKYGWLVSGGSISRAKMFYSISNRMPGLVNYYDFVAFDEIQSIAFPDKNEMQGALKGYLESGEYRVGDYRGVADAGLILLGNIDHKYMDTEQNMFTELPPFFHEDSALLDRFHGFIKGWDIPRMKENLKVNGWALNSEYFTEIIHELRQELIYPALIEEILETPKNADTRDTEAVKRICTALHKLLFPHVRDVSQINRDEYDKYCLQPAIQMRSIIKHQLELLDSEFRGKRMPDIKIKENIK